MKNALPICCLLVLLSVFMAGCSHERIYFHNKNGKVKHAHSRKLPPWFSTRERGYDKHTRRLMKHWDREQDW